MRLRENGFQMQMLTPRRPRPEQTQVQKHLRPERFNVREEKDQTDCEGGFIVYLLTAVKIISEVFLLVMDNI